MLPVVYEKYNFLLSMNIMPKFINFLLQKRIFQIINFFPVIGTNKINFLTSILSNSNQYLVILPTENIFILFWSFNLLNEIWNSGLSFHVNASILYVS